MNFTFYVGRRDIGEDETISGERRMKLLYLKIRLRMSKDSALSFPRATARKLSFNFKVRVSKCFWLQPKITSPIWLRFDTRARFSHIVKMRVMCLENVPWNCAVPFDDSSRN